MTTVYLAGKMTGLTPAQMSGWRVESFIHLEGFEVFDPVDTQLTDPPTSREIVDSNKYQISNSDVVLVELNHEEVSIGTIGEIVFAKGIGKPVIAWGGAMGVVNHPWVQEHITAHFKELGQAVDYINHNYRKR